jgi:hypothetical protein
MPSRVVLVEVVAPSTAAPASMYSGLCNNQFARCVLTDAVVAPTAFGCLVVAQGTDDTNRLFPAVSSTLELARASEETQVINAAVRGQTVDAGCNS